MLQFLQEHRELAREAVRKSLVLLKNGKYANKPVLPLSKKAPKILVAGTHANNIGNQCGGWTIQWQGQTGNITVGKSIIQIHLMFIFHFLSSSLCNSSHFYDQVPRFWMQSGTRFIPRQKLSSVKTRIPEM